MEKIDETKLSEALNRARSIMGDFENEDNILAHKVHERVQNCIEGIIPEYDKRSYRDLVYLVAALRYVADNYEDEIRDGQFLENTQK